MNSHLLKPVNDVEIDAVKGHYFLSFKNDVLFDQNILKFSLSKSVIHFYFILFFLGTWILRGQNLCFNACAISYKCSA